MLMLSENLRRGVHWPKSFHALEEKKQNDSYIGLTKAAWHCQRQKTLHFIIRCNILLFFKAPEMRFCNTDALWDSSRGILQQAVMQDNFYKWKWFSFITLKAFVQWKWKVKPFVHRNINCKLRFILEKSFWRLATVPQRVWWRIRCTAVIQIQISHWVGPCRLTGGKLNDKRYADNDSTGF